MLTSKSWFQQPGPDFWNLDPRSNNPWSRNENPASPFQIGLNLQQRVPSDRNSGGVKINCNICTNCSSMEEVQTPPPSSRIGLDSTDPLKYANSLKMNFTVEKLVKAKNHNIVHFSAILEVLACFKHFRTFKNVSRCFHSLWHTYAGSPVIFSIFIGILKPWKLF